MAGMNSQKHGVRLLHEWIDGTSVESEAGYGGYDVAASGFAWHLYESCLELFKGIVQTSGSLETQSLRECLSRFFLWGDGFGGGQLDRVIQRSDALKDAILHFIAAIAKILLENLVPQLELSSPEIPKLTDELRPLVEKVEFITSDDLDGSEDYSDSDSDVASMVSSQGGVAKNINSYVSCLMGLLPSIEHTLTLDVQEETASPPVGFHVSDAARTYVYNIHDKYKDATIELVSRLGEANFQRHIAIRRKMSQNESVIEEAEVPLFHEVQIQAPKSTFIPTSIFQDSGYGSMLPGSNFSPSIASHSSFKTDGSQGGKRSFRVPEAPIDAYEGVPFPCFICGHVLKNIKNRYDWKIHVFADLQPYICTFSECSDALSTFPTRRLWQEHEFSQHRVDINWTCPLCKAECLSPDDWNRHLETNHINALTDVEARYAFAAAKKTKVQTIELQKCPLCLVNPGTSQRAFTTHVCKHLESIALATLLNEATSDSENESTSGHSSMTSKAVEHQPASCQRDPSPTTSSVEQDCTINFTQPVEYDNGLRLLVSGLHPRLSKIEVSRLFSKYGVVKECTLCYDEYTKESAGFCYVQMATAVQTKAATEGLHCRIIKGRTLSIEYFTRERVRPTSLEVITDLSSDTEVVQDDEPLYCHCNMTSFGEMVACYANDCDQKWFHVNCVGLKVVPKGEWYCEACTAKNINSRIQEAKSVHPVHPLDSEKQLRMTPPNLAGTSPIKTAAAAAFDDEKDAKFCGAKGMINIHGYPARNTLVISNMSSVTDENVISEAFGKYGTVVNAGILRNMYSEDLKGIGYVTFDSSDGAKAGIEAMRGQEIAGLPIDLKYADIEFDIFSHPSDVNSGYTVANPELDQGDSDSERHNDPWRRPLPTVSKTITDQSALLIRNPGTADVRELYGKLTEVELKKKLVKYVKQEDKHMFRCLVPECEKVFKAEHFWMNHFHEHHLEWLERYETHSKPSGKHQSSPPQAFATSPQPLPTTSTGLTPRNLSRPKSPSSPLGPTTDDRMASSMGRIPTGLHMGILEPAATSTTAPFDPRDIFSRTIEHHLTAIPATHQSKEESSKPINIIGWRESEYQLEYEQNRKESESESRESH